MMKRRSFLQAAAATSVATAANLRNATADTAGEKSKHKVERVGIGAIGMRYQGSVIAEKARLYGDIVRIADVDRHVREQARASFGSTPKISEDYQELLADKNVDVVLIGAPDHWHAKMLIDAVRAGKDVYCEKPLTLTIDEGKVIRDVAASHDRVIQVGTWQRNDSRFRLAAEMVRAGRIGKLRRVTCTTDKNPSGGPFQPVPVPSHLNWDLWLGQAPRVPYVAERCHYTFRWWYEYAGGKMTDWGAHHVDIAQWAIGSLPTQIETRAKLPSIADGYNVATDFEADIQYQNGVQLLVRDIGRRGILFEGDRGRLFVNRSVLDGAPVQRLETDPLPREMYRLYDDDNLQRPLRAGKLDAIINHMGNFFDCVHSRRTPISDVESQHRSATTCHLANLSMRLGRSLTWDPVAENFGDDSAANDMMRRPQRSGFEVV
ncbi:Gfo/Idh/MocA family protein [Crateriforma conspicua]|uniref:Gfo/Idh/MocA family protein n=1 Tax=Crateriforma conspicua TaxID=2527996 RepID=UPI0011A83F35|nr:Gfo/Idh/MocA family oxidoreductase [Crateriforma conspicua]